MRASREGEQKELFMQDTGVVEKQSLPVIQGLWYPKWLKVAYPTTKSE